MIKRLFLLVLVGVLLASCSTRYTVKTGYYPYRVMKSVPAGYTQTGIASWYGPNFHGKRTADGEIYNMYAHTAASKTLPFNTIVKVINLNNGRSTVVRINDRGPFVKNRIIDLSYAAARDLGMIGTGTAPVKIIVLGRSGSVNSYYHQNTNTIAEEDIKELEHIDINTNIGVGEEKIVVQPRFTIQFGAFRDLSNAVRLRDRLGKLIRGVEIVRANVRGVVFYKVVLGSFGSKDAAIRYALGHVLPITKSYIISKR